MSVELTSEPVLKDETIDEPSNPTPSTKSTITTYTKDELLKLSKLPSSKAKPNFFLSGFVNDTTGLWNPVKSSDGPGVSNKESRQSEQDLKTRLGPQTTGSWVRGCDPKNQVKNEVTSVGPSPNGKTGELSLRPRGDTLEGMKRVPREIPVRDRKDSHNSGQGYEWRDKNRLSDRDRDRDAGDRPTGRYTNLDYDSRPRGGSRTQSFNNRNEGYGDRNRHRDYGYNNNYRDRQSNGYEESTPEWMDEPTSQFEMMNLGGFEDDLRGQEEEQVKSGQKKHETSIPDKQVARQQQGHDSTPEERSGSPEFEKLMQDMLKFTEDDPTTEIPVVPSFETESEAGSKSSRWFGSEGPQRTQGYPGRMVGQASYEQHQHGFVNQMPRQGSNELEQIFAKAKLMNPGVQQYAPPRTQVRSLDEIEASYRGDQSQPPNEDRQAFNKLMDMLNRRGSSGQMKQPVHDMATQQHMFPDGVRRPTSYELEEMRRQKLIEASMQTQAEHQMHLQHQEMMKEQQLRHPTPPVQRRPAFNMVPIQVIRNANPTERRGLLPSHETEGGVPRAIVGSGRGSVSHLPSGYGPDPLEMQRQMMMNQEMRRTGLNVSPINARPFPAANAIPISRPVIIDAEVGARPQVAPGHGHGHDLNRMQQIQQLQLFNQQLHNMNPSQLQQTRGMNPAQIQQFLMRS